MPSEIKKRLAQWLCFKKQKAQESSSMLDPQIGALPKAGMAQMVY